MKTIGFIGVGKMATAIISGLDKNKFKIIMPVTGSTKIRIGRQLPQLYIGWKIRKIIDHNFRKIRI